MEKLTVSQKKSVILKLQQEFNTDDFEFHGYNRFVVREKYQVELENGHTWLYKDKLFDEEGNPIPLENTYNSIFMFTAGVAVVCTRENIQIKGDRFSQERKDGLIDINGKELLPCIYDSIHPHIDGYIEITKDGQKKTTSVDLILSDKFIWDVALKCK
jgi:hypothetical protein